MSKKIISKRNRKKGLSPHILLPLLLTLGVVSLAGFVFFRLYNHDRVLGSTNRIFNADFENNSLSYFSSPRGEYFGKGTNYKAYTVSSPAIGNYSAALQIGKGPSTAMYLFTYTVPSTTIAKYSTDYWVPKGVQPDPSDYWWNIWQWKSKNETYNKPIFDLNLLTINNVLQLVLFYVPGGINTNPTQTITQTNPVAFPTDRWVNVTGVIKTINDTTGYVEIYQDGVKIFDKRGISTKPGNANLLWSINSYASVINPNPATIYVDNITIDEVSGSATTIPTATATTIAKTATPKATSTVIARTATPKPVTTPTAVVKTTTPKATVAPTAPSSRTPIPRYRRFWGFWRR